MRHRASYALGASLWLLAACNGTPHAPDPGTDAPDAAAASVLVADDEQQLGQVLSAIHTDAVTTDEETGWSATGSLAAARLLHTATKLQDGHVLVVGGYNASAEIYDPATATWRRTGDAPGNYRGATTTLLSSGKVLIAGAADSGVSAALYDPPNGVWVPTGGLMAPRYYHTATLLQDGRVLVAGGSNSEYGGSSLASVEVYDPATASWAAAAAMSVARREHTATLLASGHVLVTGGQNASGRLTTAELYDPVAGTWTTVSAMATARASHAATALASGEVLVTGGGLDGGPAASAEIYDPDSRTWSAAAGMNEPRRRHTATLMASGKVLVAGGFDNTTGIQASAELYDPLLDTWHVIAPMAMDRYQHTATLLSSGKVLVAGGFSNGNQASAELFAASYIHIVLDEGPGWQLVNVSGASTEGEVQPYNSSMYIIDGELGLASAPLPEELRNALLAEAAGEERIYFFEKSSLDALINGTAIRSAGDPGALACGGSTLHTFTEGVDLTPFLNFNNIGLGSGFSGSINTSGALLLEANAEVKLWLKHFLCLPYVEFESMRLHGRGRLDYGATLSGTLHYEHTWKHVFVNQDFLITVIAIGPILLPLRLHLPVTAGVTFQGALTGSITYAAQQGSELNLSVTCTRNQCYSDTSFEAPNGTLDTSNFTAGVAGRVNPSVWAEIAPRLYLADREAAYTQVEVRASLGADLWGYYGANCGDADGNGEMELIHGAMLDLDLGVALHAEVGALYRFKKRFPNLLSHTWHLGFWKLGGLISPMLAGTSAAHPNTSYPYQLRMRPCWPYGDAINYEVTWGDGAIQHASGAPGANQPLSHAWAQEGQMHVAARAVSDTHGRMLNETLARTILVDDGVTPPPVEYYRRVHVSGSMELVDDEWGSDDRTTLYIDETVYIDEHSRRAELHFAPACTGDEVEGSVNLMLELQEDKVTVVARAYGELYEQDSCGHHDLDGTGYTEVTVARDGAAPVGLLIENSEAFSTDSLTFNVTVTNAQR